MSLPDFQKAFARLISSAQLCEKTIIDEERFFADYDLTEREKKRLHSVLRQKGMSACCTLYRMNRITPLYTQLSNTSILLGDYLVPMADEFWQQHADTSLQFREEVFEFGNFLMRKIESDIIKIPYLKEVLQLEMAINELSYLPEGEQRVLKFDHDIYKILVAINNGALKDEVIESASADYKIYMQDQKLQLDICISGNII